MTSARSSRRPRRAVAVEPVVTRGLPDSYLDCVVAIGSDPGCADSSWVASGFLYGHPVERACGYQVYLVTNRHVFEGAKRALLRCNPRGRRPAREYIVELEDAHGNPTWVAHRDRWVDVAVVPINFELLRQHAMAVSFFVGDGNVATRRQWSGLGVTEGDPVFILGFPMGLVGGRRNTVIVRNGALARVRDTIERTSTEFLVDAFVFPGNSGGPVLLRLNAGPPLLIGIIHAYVPYQDVAVSMQTQHPRVIFEENSGLSAAHPIDFVVSAMRRHQRMVAAREAQKASASRPRAARSSSSAASRRSRRAGA